MSSFIRDGHSSSATCLPLGSVKGAGSCPLAFVVSSGHSRGLRHPTLESNGNIPLTNGVSSPGYTHSHTHTFKAVFLHLLEYFSKEKITHLPFWWPGSNSSQGESRPNVWLYALTYQWSKSWICSLGLSNSSELRFGFPVCLVSLYTHGFPCICCVWSRYCCYSSDALCGYCPKPQACVLLHEPRGLGRFLCCLEGQADPHSPCTFSTLDLKLARAPFAGFLALWRRLVFLELFSGRSKEYFLV